MNESARPCPNCGSQLSNVATTEVPGELFGFECQSITVGNCEWCLRSFIFATQKDGSEKAFRFTLDGGEEWREP
jgi:hypothetical protein